MPTPLLVLEDIHASYVKKEILRGVSLMVDHGQIVALLGGNGAGKSTMLKVIAGLLQPVKGRIWFHGKEITKSTPHQRQTMGIGCLLQGGRVFPNLSVEDNLSVSLAHVRDAAHKNDNRPALGSVFPELASRRSIRAGLLSGGQRQMLAIEMVLAQKPRLALLDEPTGGLALALANRILEQLCKTATSDNTAVVLVEQNVEKARCIAHRSTSLDQGHLKADDILHNL